MADEEGLRKILSIVGARDGNSLGFVGEDGKYVPDGEIARYIRGFIGNAEVGDVVVYLSRDKYEEIRKSGRLNY